MAGPAAQGRSDTQVTTGRSRCSASTSACCRHQAARPEVDVYGQGIAPAEPARQGLRGDVERPGERRFTAAVLQSAQQDAHLGRGFEHVLDRLSSRNQPHEDHDHGDHQEHMDEAAQRGRGHQPYQPQEDEDDGDRIEHAGKDAPRTRLRMCASAQCPGVHGAYRPAVATDVRETWRLARERGSMPATEPVRLRFWRKAAGQ